MSTSTPQRASVPTGNAYDKYTAGNRIERRLVEGFFTALDAALPSEAPSAILEVGLGEGEVSAYVRSRYPAASIVGVDLPDPALARSWGAKGLAGGFADIVALPFPSSSFDLVLGIEVLEHLPDPGRALEELTRVGRSRFVVSVPREPVWRLANIARGKYVKHLGNTPGHIQHWSKRGFAAFVDQHLRVERIQSPFPWTMVSANR